MHRGATEVCIIGGSNACWANNCHSLSHLFFLFKYLPHQPGFPTPWLSSHDNIMIVLGQGICLYLPLCGCLHRRHELGLFIYEWGCAIKIGLLRVQMVILLQTSYVLRVFPPFVECPHSAGYVYTVYTNMTKFISQTQTPIHVTVSDLLYPLCNFVPSPCNNYVLWTRKRVTTIMTPRQYYS